MSQIGELIHSYDDYALAETSRAAMTLEVAKYPQQLSGVTPVYQWGQRWSYALLIHTDDPVGSQRGASRPRRPTPMAHCPCIIRCATHRATSTILAETRRTAETVQKLSQELNAILADAVSDEGLAVTREDAIAVLRALMEDLDHFGEISIHTIEQVRQLMTCVDGRPEASIAAEEMF